MGRLRGSLPKLKEKLLEALRAVLPIVGIVLALCGIVSAVRALELRQYPDYSWVVALVVGVLVAIGGVVIIVNPFESTVTFVLVLGVALLVNGIGELFIEGQLRRLEKQAAGAAGMSPRP